MSEMGSDTPVPPETGADRLNVSLVAFTGCVGSSVEDICTYSLTIGEAYVPFDPDPEDECEQEDTCAQVWVRVAAIDPKGQDSWEGDCATTMSIDLEVGVLRCFDIPEDGEAPTASQVLAAAMQSMEDMNSIYCAAMNCEVWNAINSGIWTPMGPLGGQFGGVWTFTVEI